MNLLPTVSNLQLGVPTFGLVITPMLLFGGGGVNLYFSITILSPPPFFPFSSLPASNSDFFGVFFFLTWLNVFVWDASIFHKPVSKSQLNFSESSGSVVDDGNLGAERPSGFPFFLLGKQLLWSRLIR